MAKITGLPVSITLDNAAGVAKVITNDVTSCSVTTSRATQDITGLDKYAIERLLLLADAKITMTGVFNTAADMSHAVLSTAISTNPLVTRTLAIGYTGATLTLETVVENYDVNRAADGSLVWSSTLSQCNGTAPVWS